MPNKTIFKKKEKKTLLDKKLSDGNILKLTLKVVYICEYIKTYSTVDLMSLTSPKLASNQLCS